VESASCSLKAFVEKLGVKPNCAQWWTAERREFKDLA
jgi:hypothetical protein